MRFSEIAMRSQFSLSRAVGRRLSHPTITPEDHLDLMNNEAMIRSLTNATHLYFSADPLIVERMIQYLDQFIRARRNLGKNFNRDEIEGQQDSLNDLSNEIGARMGSILNKMRPMTSQDAIDVVNWTRQRREEMRRNT